MIKNVKKFPKNPGVYFFRDKNRAKTRSPNAFARSGLHSKPDLGQVLYIGKAANLKNRLKSYFDKTFQNPRLQKMLEAAKSVDWQETSSEIEALILESQLIKKYRPPFNIMLRDDKQYFFVGFTAEQFPKIFLTHQIQNTKYKILNTKFIGPFTDGMALCVTLKLLRKIFPYCTCKQKHNNYCLNYHLGNCLGFCCLKQQNTKSKAEVRKLKAEYGKNIKAVGDILTGKKNSLIEKFEKELNALAQKEKFEKAIELRDKIEKLKRVFENAKIIAQGKHYNSMIYHNKSGLGDLVELKKNLKLPVLPRRIEGYDVSNIQGKFATGAMAVFIDGQPDKNEYRKFKIRTTSKPNDVAMLKEVLTRRFNHPEWQYPDLILIDGGKAQLNAARSAILGHRKSYGLAMSINSIPIIALTKDAKHKGHHIYASTKKSAMPLKNLPSAVRNLILQIDAEAHRFAISYYRKLHQIKTGLLSHDSSPAERLG